MKTVLVADDKETSRELIRTVLEGSGHAVREAGDGIEAVDGQAVLETEGHVGFSYSG